MHNKKEVSRQIYRMLIPMILENVLTTSASLVTTAMVGRLTALEISAQGVGGRITNTYLSLFKGLAIGVTVVAALYFGQMPPYCGTGFCHRGSFGADDHRTSGSFSPLVHPAFYL